MSDCIETPYSKDIGGYGRKYYNGNKRMAHHKWVWIQANGPIPDGMVVMHSCDNRGCINLEHLSLGTQKDNIHDMYRKGRAAAQKDPEANSQRLKAAHAARKDPEAYSELRKSTHASRRGTAQWQTDSAKFSETMKQAWRKRKAT